MEIEHRGDQPPERIGDADRSRVVELLQCAAGDGRVTLEEFSERAATAWGAETREDLDRATAGLGPVERVVPEATTTLVSVLGDQRRVGRWRAPAKVRGVALLGDIHLDLRHALVTTEVIDIRALSLFGSITVDVPEGIDVELTGFDLLGDRELRLAPVPPRRGAPLVRVRAYGLLGDVTVRTPRAGEDPPSWWRWFHPRQRKPS